MTRPGLAAGAGLEWAWSTSWSIKAEYLYLDFGSWAYASDFLPGSFWVTNIRLREQVARLGLNFRFGGGPVVGNY